MRLSKCLAVGVVVTVMALSFPAVAATARPRTRGPVAPTTGLWVPGSSVTSTTTTLPRVSAKADRVLKRLLSTVALITEDDQKAAALSEFYDLERCQLAAAKREIATLDSRIRIADLRESLARESLRQTAIRAYVSGELDEVGSGLLSASASEHEMARVYAGVALGQLHQALSLYEATSNAADASRTGVVETSRQIARTLASLASVRASALKLVRRASGEYASISRRLLGLVGAKEFKLLFSPPPSGSPYRGPDLAGTDVSHVATQAQGLRAAKAAIEFLGVPYVFGGVGRAGIDCSGLTMRAWAAAGYSLAHSATLQWEESRPVSLGHLEPGDLLFYHFAHDGPNAISHVVMYLGSGPYGAETVIQAAEPGTNVAVGPIFFEGLVSAGQP
ncbi:MAG: NlpC/P60 family protein [Acidimicrobiales bacterium]